MVIAIAEALKPRIDLTTFRQSLLRKPDHNGSTTSYLGRSSTALISSSNVAGCRGLVSNRSSNLSIRAWSRNFASADMVVDMRRHAR